MKKSILLLSIGVLSIGLMAFGFSEWNNTSCKTKSNVEKIKSNFYIKSDPKEKVEEIDFAYSVSPRFQPITKRITDNATSITDFLNLEEINEVEKYKSVSLIIIKKDVQTKVREIGFTEKLTDGQMQLLRSLDYSANFTIRAEYYSKDKKTHDSYRNYFSPHHTIVPEKQAEYVQGEKALINQLKVMNKQNTLNLDKDKLRPAKLYFTVAKDGSLKNINLDRSCGYTNIDINIIELITNTKGNWTPAENMAGEKVDQELVVSFGMMGC
jgi:hypothetical protein